MPDEITSVDPATLQTNGTVEAADPKQVEQTVADARAAQADWADLALDDRLEILDELRRILVDRGRDLAETVTAETGKPVGEALAADVIPFVDAVDWVTDAAPDILDEPLPVDHPLAIGRTSRILREPVGVVAHITPWNYPLGIPGSQVVYALAAGNAAVVKPATETPLTAEAIGEALADAGVPDDLVGIVHGPGSSTGQALVEADVDHLIFTGSREVGWTLREELASRGVPTCLELGGSDPAIVLDDADLDLAADGIVWARYTNAGQTCAAVKRVVAHDGIVDELTDRIVAKVEELTVGDGRDPGTEVGPMISADAVDELLDQIERSVDDGATVLTGGEAIEGDGHFVQPTVLTDVTPEMPVLSEETFGPALAIVEADDVDDAIAKANATAFGLTASVWTRDVERGRELAADVEAGTVIVNDHAYTYGLNATPWGGVKDSGGGRTHGRWGLEEVTEAKHVHAAKGRRNLWWFPYPDDQTDLMETAVEALYGDGLVRRLGGLVEMISRMRSKEGL